MKTIVILLLILMGCNMMFGQTFDTITVHPDVKDAQILAFPSRCCFIAPIPSPGPGMVADYNNPGRKNAMLLTSEKNSSWHYLMIPYDGLLYMDLIPLDSTNDYDFAFFNISQGAPITQLLKEVKMGPAVSCISRNDSRNDGVTGMKDGTEELFVNIGPGKQFIRPLEVHMGEKWLIYIDNNAKHGKGFKLKFQIKKVLSIQGVVKDDEGKNVKANISVLNDRTGEKVHSMQTNDSGKFSFRVPMGGQDIYTVLYTGADHFFISQTIRSQDLSKGGEMKVTPVLPVLKEGKIIPVNNINFFGDAAIVIPASKPVLRQLLQLMEDQKELHIRICGHVNGCERGKEYTQKLSDDRAGTVYTFLKDHGIEANRMQMRGYGCNRMIFPKPKNEFENEQNRRVEIEILKMR